MVHNKVDHKFASPRFEWDTPENYQPCIKLSFFFSKLPSISYTHFQKHYNHVHADLTIACSKFNAVKIQRYTQLYQSPEMKNKLKSLGMEVLDYDACSTIWVRSWDDWMEFASSKEYAAALMGDADHFMDHRGVGIRVMAGHEMIAFGKAIPGCDATDGITREEGGEELTKVDSLDVGDKGMDRICRSVHVESQS